MKSAFLLSIFLITSARAGDLISNMKLLSEQDGESRYEGRAFLEGTFSIYEDGELTFQPKKSKQAIGFSNSDQALQLLGLEKLMTKIDATKICGLRGMAKIEISGLVAGEGPSRAWQTKKLERIIYKTQPMVVGCKASKQA